MFSAPVICVCIGLTPAADIDRQSAAERLQLQFEQYYLSQFASDEELPPPLVPPPRQAADDRTKSRPVVAQVIH
ncbi:hypothetical protein NK718_07750 [Alsobacter sp. SYSU M60028]|uniref:Uncharacterized protein n=1 Tax=Alsobacter ponti TaxID=2962936 RepID=A0ABT1LBR3_9HYPH|nr:hypothetical protein [Alsobacter ponti]MCP8938406.1 hypothetical protein [Alsobacter ponti]